MNGDSYENDSNFTLECDKFYAEGYEEEEADTSDLNPPLPHEMDQFAQVQEEPFILLKQNFSWKSALNRDN